MTRHIACSEVSVIWLVTLLQWIACVCSDRLSSKHRSQRLSSSMQTACTVRRRRQLH